MLAPDGRVHHATGAVRDRATQNRLRSFAKEVDGARSGSKRSSRESALQAWTALVEGRWSMVDHFDTDGRRFCIFLRNEPLLDHPRPLGTTERQVVSLAALGLPNKLIAYELGLVPTRVATDLRRGMQKLGVRRRADLIQSLGMLASAAAPAR